MAARRTITLLVLVLLLAGCGQDESATLTGDGANGATTTTTTVAEDPTTTSTVTATTSTVAPTTTVTVAPTTTSTTTTSTIPHADQALPGSFGTMGQLYSRTNPDSLRPLNAQVVNSLGSCEGEQEIAEQCSDAWEWLSVDITYFEGLTVWDLYDTARVAARHGGPQMLLLDDGTWYESEDEVVGTYGFPWEWELAQINAASCIEQGAEAIGLDTTAGTSTLHIRCELGGGSGGGSGFQEVWIGEQGHVMKIHYEFFIDPVSAIAVVWEVTALDVEHTGPLPPGW